MEITGKLIKKLEPISGEGKNGTWTKQTFVIETEGQYPKQIAFDCFNDKCELIRNRIIGEQLTVKFDLESREYNGKYFTNVNAYSVTGPAHEAKPVDSAQPAPGSPDLPTPGNPASLPF